MCACALILTLLISSSFLCLTWYQSRCDSSVFVSGQWLVFPAWQSAHLGAIVLLYISRCSASLCWCPVVVACTGALPPCPLHLSPTTLHWYSIISCLRRDLPPYALCRYPIVGHLHQCLAASCPAWCHQSFLQVPCHPTTCVVHIATIVGVCALPLSCPHSKLCSP